MEPVRRPALYWRAVVTFSVVFSFVVLAASGLVLYVAPPGRVANWSEWRFAALLKADWQALHTVFSFVFVVGAACHLAFNWRVIATHVRRTAGRGMNRGRELALTGAAGFLIAVLTLAGLPPSSTIVAVGDAARRSWSDPSAEPPVPHAELWTLTEFAEANMMAVDRAMENLRAAHMAAPAVDATLQALATAYKTTPRQVYLKALGTATAASVPPAEGGGYGRKTIGQLCADVNVPIDTAIERLKQAGIADASAGRTVRELASGGGKRPIDIVHIVRGQADAAEEGR